MENGDWNCCRFWVWLSCYTSNLGSMLPQKSFRASTMDWPTSDLSYFCTSQIPSTSAWQAVRDKRWGWHRPPMPAVVEGKIEIEMQSTCRIRPISGGASVRLVVIVGHGQDQGRVAAAAAGLDLDHSKLNGWGSWLERLCLLDTLIHDQRTRCIHQSLPP